MIVTLDAFIGLQMDNRAQAGQQQQRQRLPSGPATVRRFLPDLMQRVLYGKMKLGKVFDLVLPPAQVAEGYKAMDERRAIKTLLRVD